RRGDPMTGAGHRGDLAVQAHGPLQRDRGPAQRGGDEEVEIEARGLLREDPHLDLDPRRPEPRETLAANSGVRVAVARYDAGDASRDDGVGARRGPPMMGAGLQ